MAKKLTDLSQLTKAILKESPPPRHVEKPAPEPSQSREDADAAAVLAYFSRPSQNAPQRNRAASCAVPAKDRTVVPEAALEAKDAALAALAEEKAYPPTAKQSPEGAATRGAADARIAELEQQLATEREAHEAAVRERDRLQGECGRLQGELRKRSENAPVAAPVEVAPVAKDEPPKPTQGILAAPGAVAEVFPGEVREQVVATLLDGLGSAERSGRERRAEILRCVLAANQSAGELERRRVELRQILKDAGYFNDPKPLERLGLRLISGHNHWHAKQSLARLAA